MTQYSNPDLTQREIVENSILAIETLIENVDATAAAGSALTGDALDFQTVQFVNQHISMLNGTKFQLNSELTRLKNIIAVWNGEEPLPTGTPTLPLTTAS